MHFFPAENQNLAELLPQSLDWKENASSSRSSTYFSATIHYPYPYKNSTSIAVSQLRKRTMTEVPKGWSRLRTLECWPAIHLAISNILYMTCLVMDIDKYLDYVDEVMILTVCADNILTCICPQSTKFAAGITCMRNTDRVEKNTIRL